MIIHLHTDSARQTTWIEYLERFVFGGAMTVVAWLIAKKYGPAIGGLFLAFPAIFPASVTLVEKHERQRKAAAGLRGIERGTDAAAADAAGATIGAIGLLAFALLNMVLFGRWPAIAVLLTSAVVWFLLATASWLLWKWRRRFSLKRLSGPSR